MERQDAFVVVSREREYQDKTYNPQQVLASGLTREQRDKDVMGHLVMLDTYVRKAQDAWTNGNGSSFESLRQIAKIAAIAVRAIERCADSERLVTEGLR